MADQSDGNGVAHPGLCLKNARRKWPIDVCDQLLFVVYSYGTRRRPCRAGLAPAASATLEPGRLLVRQTRSLFRHRRSLFPRRFSVAVKRAHCGPPLAATWMKVKDMLPAGRVRCIEFGGYFANDAVSNHSYAFNSVGCGVRSLAPRSKTSLRIA